MPGVSYNLLLEDAGAGVEVQEAVVGNQLPAACPERHINSDGTFCIGLHEGRRVTSEQEASNWWFLLADYLRCQQAAAKYGRWPPGHWLSHGQAAFNHLQLEKLAAEVGWQKEVFEAIEYGKGWLASKLPRARKNSEMLVNQRRPCPRGCKRKGSPILRRQCPNRNTVFDLVRNEWDRRKFEMVFVEEFKDQNFTCCGTMIECPFR